MYSDFCLICASIKLSVILTQFVSFLLCLFLLVVFGDQSFYTVGGHTQGSIGE